MIYYEALCVTENCLGTIRPNHMPCQGSKNECPMQKPIPAFLSVLRSLQKIQIFGYPPSFSARYWLILIHHGVNKKMARDNHPSGIFLGPNDVDHFGGANPHDPMAPTDPPTA